MAFFGEALASHDRAAQISVFPVRRDVYIGESDAEAAATASPLIESGYRGIDRSSLIVGGPETAVAALQDLEERGFNHALIRFLPVGQDKILESIARIGRDVIPELRTTGG